MKFNWWCSVIFPVPQVGSGKYLYPLITITTAAWSDAVFIGGSSLFEPKASDKHEKGWNWKELISTHWANSL